MTTVLPWLRSNAAALLSAIVVTWIVVALVRAAIAARRGRAPSVIEDFERAQKVRQQIRRKITERRENPGTGATRTARRPNGPVRGVRPIDPFGGPTRGWWTRVRRWFGRGKMPRS